MSKESIAKYRRNENTEVSQSRNVFSILLFHSFYKLFKFNHALTLKLNSITFHILMPLSFLVCGRRSGGDVYMSWLYFIYLRSILMYPYTSLLFSFAFVFLYFHLLQILKYFRSHPLQRFLLISPFFGSVRERFLCAFELLAFLIPFICTVSSFTNYLIFIRFSNSYLICATQIKDELFKNSGLNFLLTKPRIFI